MAQESFINPGCRSLYYFNTRKPINQLQPGKYGCYIHGRKHGLNIYDCNDYWNYQWDTTTYI